MKTYNKRLYRSEDNKIFFGIMGGFGDYFDIDPTILRAFYIVASVFTAIIPGIIAYIFMALVVPKHPDVIIAEATKARKEEEEQKHAHKAEEKKEHSHHDIHAGMGKE